MGLLPINVTDIASQHRKLAHNVEHVASFYQALDLFYPSSPLSNYKLLYMYKHLHISTNTPTP